MHAHFSLVAKLATWRRGLFLFLLLFHSVAFATLVSSPTSHDYGDVGVDGSASQTFAITNDSTNTIEVMDVFAHAVTMTDEMGNVTTVTDEIGSPTTSGNQIFIIEDDQCTDKTITPNKGCSVAVKFAPLQAATFEATLNISHSAATEALSIALKGTGVSKQDSGSVSVSPDELNFGTIPMQTRSDSLSATIANNGADDLEIEKLQIEGSDFVLVEHDCSFGSVLDQACTVHIAFNPQSAGAKSGNLIITSNDTTNPTTKLLLTGEASGTPNINVQPDNGDIGDVKVGEAKRLQFTVSNLGTDGLELGESSVDNEIFTLTDQCADQVLGVNQSCNIGVSFKPQEADEHQGVLTIPSNDPDTPDFTVDLSASGVCGSDKFVVSAYPNPLDFGGVALSEGSLTSYQGIFAWSKGCQAIDIDDIKLVGNDASEFSLKKLRCYTGYWQSYDAVYSSVYCPVKVTLTPATLGEKNAQLEVAFNNGYDEKFDISANIIDAEPNLSVSEEQVDFGEVKVGFSGEDKTLTLTNTGNINIRFKDIGFTEGNADDFQAQGWQCHPYFPLKPGKSCDLTLRFNPSEEGDKEATLMIDSNAPDASVTVTGTAISAEVCNNPTIESTGMGEWDKPATWGGSVPTENDVVKIASIVSASNDAVKVKSLCIATNGMLVSHQDGSAIDIQASEYIENKGTILGSPGASESSDVTCTKREVGKILRTGGQCAQPGASVILKVGKNIKKKGKAGDFWWYARSSGGPIYNTGTIQAGNGGNAKNYAADGGAVMLLGRNTTNLGKVIGGHGGNLTGTDKGRAGEGGLVQLWGKLGGRGYLKNIDGAEASAGNGGNCNASATAKQKGGNGGNLWLVSLPDVFLNNSINEAGKAGANCHRAKDGWVRIEPTDGTISLSGQGTKISGGDIYIYGGQNWTLDMSNMSSGAIQSSGKVTLAVGEGSVVDMSGNSAPIINANEVEIFADNIQTDDDKSIEDTVNASNIVVSNGRVLQDASLVGTKKAYQTPNSVLALNMSLSNNGAEADTYTLAVTDSAGWSITGLPKEVDLEALTNVDLVLNITLSQNIGETNQITVTATSKSNPEVVTTMQFQVTVVGEDENVVAVDESQLQNLIQANGGNIGGSGGGSGPGFAACPSAGNINTTCVSSGSQVLINVNIASGVMVSQATLGGTITNAGMVSQATIQEGATLQGGKLTGYIQNSGTVMDIEFVGAVLKGGILGGAILNTSQAGGVLENVSFAPNAKVRGGKLRGKVAGDIKAPALLENVEIEKGTQLEGVIIGDGVTLADDTTLGQGVRYNISLPNVGGLTSTINPLGEFGESAASFFGGSALSTTIDSDDFFIDRKVAGDQTILYAANIAVDPAHVGQQADLLFVVGVEPPPAPYDGGVDTTYVAFNEELQSVLVDLYASPDVWMAQLTEPVISDVTLEDKMALNVWQGALGIASKYYVFAGYRLHEDGTIVFNTQPIMIEVE